MISCLDTHGGQRLLLGFLLLVGSVPLVWTTDYSSLDATSYILEVGDRLVSSPNHYFELGIFTYYNSGVATPSYYLSIRYAPPIVQAVTWIASRGTRLTGKANLQLQGGNLKLSDHTITPDNIWSTTGTDNGDVVSAKLLDTGKLVLINNQNGKEVWNSFDNDSPTDTLLPGQYMHRKKGHRLNSWQRTGDPAIANDTYSFGWDTRGVLTLSWTCPNCNLDWKGGPYIPAPDVYAAHTIRNRDKVYFHKDLGHLYMDSDPPTAILSGGPDRVNSTTLKRITMSSDGGLRILQYTINQSLPLDQTSNQISNQTWEAVANWVVSDRPECRSQCATIGTCGQFSMCFSLIDSLEQVECRCPGSDYNLTRGWFTPIDLFDAAKGCTPQTGPNECSNKNGNITGTKNPGMLELPGVDMPWGGDYEILLNLPANSSSYCQQECVKDCYCTGAVYSEAEHKCWKKNGPLYNLGYPTEALYGTDRISFLRNQTVPGYKKTWAAKDHKLVTILVSALGAPAVLLIVVAIFCLWRKERLQQWLPDWGSCCKRRVYEIRFPDETPLGNARGDGL